MPEFCRRWPTTTVSATPWTSLPLFLCLRKNTSKKKRVSLLTTRFRSLQTKVMTVSMRSLMQLVMLQISRMVLTRDLP
uniref:Uncharacterized protein n=1 Tax=Oryza sativa subsp. japonica TaxID=39947 RepID=Q69KR6_ORYSJ|nr:unknown protein [Oryza sativa Japonica Group]BAD69140.1 unknown protein [Oryza sativa Japonica Group]